ncbi:MAG: hypothetical protein D6785_03025 [Planctomycetota bacterium]|nr:MAG: hypothetical protein D6785_03025 [Planctomycetota bacterium]
MIWKDFEEEKPEMLKEYLCYLERITYSDFEELVSYVKNYYKVLEWNGKEFRDQGEPLKNREDDKICVLYWMDIPKVRY